jgi:tyrosyl-tRNA synthetase
MNIDQQVEYLMQGTQYGDENLTQTMRDELRARLVEAQAEGRPLRVYCGFDPRTSDLHIGHTVPMRKLRQFQELGHHVIFLVGNYTSLIGDPSDKDVLREQLTSEEIARNARTYAEQAYKVLDADKTEVKYNAEWLSELTFSDLIKLASNFTVQQFLTRDNFRKRFDKGDAIYLHETFYSIMQAYDAYMLRADVQVGGTDQLFNIVTASRKLMSYMGVKPNIAIINDILPGTDGEIKMSKSLGNHIPLLATPEDMFGKVMSVPDKAMPYYFRMVTRWTPDEIVELEAGVKNGKLHPRDVKMKLAHEIVSIYISEDAAKKGQDAFVQVFQKGDVPDDMPEYGWDGEKTLLDVLDDAGLISSRGQGRRLIKQNAVRFEGETLSDPFALLPGEGVLQVGKRKFVRVTR